MNILMLTPYLPYPIWSGGQIRTYNLLKNLSKKHSITLFSFVRDTKEREYIPRLLDYCESVQVFVKRPPWSLTSLALAATTFYPLVVCMYLNRNVRNAIRTAIQEKHFDLIHAETFYVMPNIPQNSIPTILVEQTIEYLVYQHFTKSVSFLPKKLLMKWDVSKIRFWEERFWRKATRVVAMSEADRRIMQQLVSKLTVDLVPNGVDVEFFSEKKKHHSSNGKTVLFVGNFKWLQNREAVSILIREVWPKIISSIPDAKLWIVGRHPGKDIQDLVSSRIRISDDIGDIREAYQKSDVLLAPIYGPGGTRYKILESMAAELPVVTTPTGIEGIGAKHKKDALIGETSEELAQATIDVLRDNSLHQTLAFHGRKLAEHSFNWKTIASSLDRIYKEAAYGKQN